MLGLAAQQFEITRRVDAFELLVARVARSQGLRQNAARLQARLHGLDSVGALGVDDLAEVIPVKGIDDELQPECLTGLHGSAAAWCTCWYAFASFFKPGSASSRLYAAVAFEH